jgi:CxxC motif-containing protein (DUF1111 family)
LLNNSPAAAHEGFTQGVLNGLMEQRIKPILFNTALLLACSGALILHGQRPAPPRAPGDPLPGLTPAQMAEFQAGRADFLEVETEEDGLGPTYNATSCAACHNLPGVGGAGNTAVIRAGRLENGVFTSPAGTNLIHLFSTPEHGCQAQIPEDANVVIRRIPTPVFGAGLMEAIPDATIRAGEDPTDRNGDGIRGRVAMVTDLATNQQRVGRFGWKNQHATLLSFAADAYLFEMGITNDLVRDETAAGIPPQKLAECDKVPGNEDPRDPATGRRGIDNFANFMRFLAPPDRGNGGPDAQRGAQLFREIGCATCHTPVMTTGPNPTIPALDRRPVAIYSDLLLHDIGTGDNIPQGAADGNEFRSAPLWGMRVRKMLMHDGSALSPTQAIEQHGREGERSRQRFRGLSPQDQRALLAYLNSI